MAIRIEIPASVKIISSSPTKAVFGFEGLYPGYGITVGNALRRVLLSSLPGAAITSFRIEGVQHEFSTIPGVLEDVVEISLNLKRLRFRMFSEEPVELKLSAKGEREICGRDISKHAQIEIVNPDAHIATLTSKSAALEMTMTVEKGIGYLPVELRKKEKLSIGEIAIDAIFSPVERVNFEVENMRVGDRTDYNRLRLTVETDGSIDPVTAVKESSIILSEHFRPFMELISAEAKESIARVKNEKLRTKRITSKKKIDK